MNDSNNTLCIVGASGLVGSNIVKEALSKTYKVRGTLRDINAPDKASILNSLPNAHQNLNLFKAKMADRGSFD
tara:strand:- start:194 stop:412 length:219 start_codon:yes stop_codon:yes gene_type:complete